MIKETEETLESWTISFLTSLLYSAETFNSFFCNNGQEEQNLIYQLSGFYQNMVQNSMILGIGSDIKCFYSIDNFVDCANSYYSHFKNQFNHIMPPNCQFLIEESRNTFDKCIYLAQYLVPLFSYFNNLSTGEMIPSLSIRKSLISLKPKYQCLKPNEITHDILYFYTYDVATEITLSQNIKKNVYGDCALDLREIDMNCPSPSIISQIDGFEDLINDYKATYLKVLDLYKEITPSINDFHGLYQFYQLESKNLLSIFSAIVSNFEYFLANKFIDFNEFKEQVYISQLEENEYLLENLNHMHEKMGDLLQNMKNCEHPKGININSQIIIIILFKRLIEATDENLESIEDYYAIMQKYPIDLTLDNLNEFITFSSTLQYFNDQKNYFSYLLESKNTQNNQITEYIEMIKSENEKLLNCLPKIVNNDDCIECCICRTYCLASCGHTFCEKCMNSLIQTHQCSFCSTAFDDSDIIKVSWT